MQTLSRLRRFVVAGILWLGIASSVGREQAGGAQLAQQSPQDSIAPARSAAPTIASLFPDSGPFGTPVTIRGSGFNLENTIRFQGVQDSFDIVSVRSESGVTLVFQVSTCPSYQPGCPARYIAPGSYKVTVINANGSSNQATFTLNARTGRSVITSASPVLNL
jgi:hypothetical protein